MSITDPDTGLHLDVNETWLNVLGYDRNDVIGKTVETIGLWDNLIQRSEMVALLLRDGEMRNFEARFRRKDGTLCIVLLSGRVIIYEGHRRFLLIGQDVTDVRHAYDALRKSRDELETQVVERTQQLHSRIEEYRFAQAALEESENRFRVFAETASDWYWESDAKHRFSWFSDGLTKALNTTPTVLEGKTRWELAAEDTHTERWRAHQDDMDAHRPFRDFMYEAHTPFDEPIWVSASGDPRFGKDGTFLGYRGTARDVSNSVLDRRKIEDARREAERANAAKSEFLAHMSHELRTPLNAIFGFAQLLDMTAEAGVPLSQDDLEYVHHIMSSGEHLLSLISNVLDLAKIEAGSLDIKTETVDLEQCLDECLSIVSRLAAVKEVTILPVSKRAPLGVVIADPLRLRQVFLNMLSNAVKYNRVGGNLEVRSMPSADGRSVRIFVRDCGYGIPETFHDRVFLPFSREGMRERQEDGAGIGLAITKELVERMGGSIGFDSEEGAGTEFWVDLLVGGE